ncbi:MAG TPA: hypothetical protein VNF68_04370, partial [Candidatus Baltobacteraceae bacterium]|nr:hypothetical protein [Candidatus Baltobacteraceae bacterium]
RRISIPVMIERMREIATFEGIKIDDAALAAIAYRADGGLRDALTMLEQAAAFADGEITTGTIELAFGATGRNFANTLIDAVLARDASLTLRTVEEASDAGADMQVLIRTLIANFRNLLVARVDPVLLARDLAPEDAQRATERAQTVGNATIVRALRVLSDAAQLARTGGNARLEIETALLRLILEEGEGSAAPVGRPAVVEKAPAAPTPAPVTPSASPLVTPSASPLVTPSVAQRSRGAAPKPEPTPPKPEPTPSVTPSESGPITVQKLRAAWMNIRGKVEHERPPLRVPLSGAMVDAIDENAAVVKLRSKLDVDILKEHVGLLEKAIHNVLGADMKVRLEVGVAPPPAAHDDAPPVDDIPPESADELFGYANERITPRSS